MSLEFLVPVILTLVLALIFTISKLRELLSERKLRKLISWIMVSNTQSSDSHEFPLWAYLSNAQLKFKIKSEYCITGERDWEIVRKILKKFQEDTSQSYFQDRLKPIKGKYEIYGEHYFMRLLCSFLLEHQCDSSFFGDNMHQETISYKSYGSWGGQLYDAAYSLTDFAIVYHKMYYITCVFCKNCTPIIESNMKLWLDEKSIEEILDTKQIKISRA